MSVRIRKLAHLDPRACPLPHGTEVTTCVDRVIGDRVLQQGAVGRVATPLPAKPDVARADALLRRIRVELARRHVERAPGPFGRDAPEPPEARWEDEP